MKKIALMILACLCTIGAIQAQSEVNGRYRSSSDSILAKIELDLSLKRRYKLYPTENIYTFLQLDTKTGMIEQIQWSLDANNEGSVSINDEDLTYGFGNGSGTFELYPTKNMYQFLLLNKTNGRKWHIQWGMEENERWIRRIYDFLL